MWQRAARFLVGNKHYECNLCVSIWQRAARFLVEINIMNAVCAYLYGRELHGSHREINIMKRQGLCGVHSLMSVRFLMYLLMNDLLLVFFVCCCCNLMFYDWRECVMSVLGTTKHS